MNIYQTIEQHAPYCQGFLGVEVRSPTKIKHHTKTIMQKRRKNMMIDIECNLIETTRIGQTNGGTQVLGVCNVDGNTIINQITNCNSWKTIYCTSIRNWNGRQLLYMDISL